ncbi:MAG: hypothetical protein GY834_16740 [Bacteroidetes bacterium]|nr:hypothetical protein [Bacteroidota bacterium]
MKNLFTVIIVILVCYFGWQKIFHKSNQTEGLYEDPYVIVYGRDSCGWTQQYLKDLKNEGIELIYESVDNEGVGDELHSRMREAGIDTRRYNLPVIDVNGQIFVRPKLDIVLEVYEIIDQG